MSVHLMKLAAERHALALMAARSRDLGAAGRGESTTEMPPNPGVTPEEPRLSTKCLGCDREDDGGGSGDGYCTACCCEECLQVDAALADLGIERESER